MADPFNVSPGHLLRVLNDPEFKKRMDVLGMLYSRNSSQCLFVVQQDAYSAAYSISDITALNRNGPNEPASVLIHGSTLCDSLEYPALSPSHYNLMEVHSHKDGKVLPFPDELTAPYNRRLIAHCGSIEVLPIICLVGSSKKKNLDILLMQQRDNIDFDLEKAQEVCAGLKYPPLVGGFTPSLIAQGLEELEDPACFNALALKYHRDNGVSYSKAGLLERFAFIPSVAKPSARAYARQ